MHHNLKAIPISFQPLWDGKLTHQNRASDRPFAEGDTVTFHEGRVEGSIFTRRFIPTGRTISAEISFVTTYGLQKGLVGLSLKRIGITPTADFLEPPNGL